MSQTIDRPPLRQSPAFVTTHWSVVLAAARADRPQSREAWDTLARNYWLPLYAFVRKSGHPPNDACDLTQDFFVALIQRRMLESLAQGQGRFRSFLLVCLKNFLIDQRRRTEVLRRRLGESVAVVDAQEAETLYQAELVEPDTPENLYERQWAVRLLDQALAGLEAYYTDQGKAKLYQHLASHLANDPDKVPHAALATRLQMTEGAVKSEMYRLRQRMQKFFCEQVAATVPKEEVEAEIRHVVKLLRR